MKAKPYVGITGPATRQQVESVIEEFSKAGYVMFSPHTPMLGYLVSYKTLNGETVKNRRYPKINELEDLLKTAGNKVLTMIHYNSKEMSTLAKQISKLFDGIYQEGLCRAMQLNIVWPDPAQIGLVKKEFPEMQIVFQLSHKAAENKTTKQIINEIKRYDNTLSYVLIDPSRGRGLEFNIKESLEVYVNLKTAFHDLTIGFAGGFSGENVTERVKRLIDETEDLDFCIDAEGGLRDKVSDAYGDDLLNIEKVKAYLQGSSSVLK